MNNVIVFLILTASVYYTGRRLYKQIFKGGGCSSCDCGNGDSSCSYDLDLEPEKN